MSRVRFGWFGAIVFVCMSTMAIMAQRPAATFPVIVIFHEDAPFDSFAPGYRGDARGAADPDAWGYLNRGVAGAVQALEARQGFRAEHVYSAALRGFSAQLTARQIADLEDDPSVAYIEPDGEMHAIAQILPWGIDKIEADLSSTQAGNGSGAITNVNVYIIDTGIFTHADLNRGAHVNFAGGKNDDCHGHGTHVAGTVSARDNTSDVVGVAPGAQLTGVKVLGCNGSGSTSGVIKGVDWVTANASEAGRGEHEPGRQRQPGARRRREALGSQRRLLRACRRQQRRQRVQLVAGARRRRYEQRHHDRRRDGFRRPGSVLEQLRQLRRHLGPWRQHPVDTPRRRHDDDVRHLDGLTARRRRRRPLSLNPHRREPVER